MATKKSELQQQIALAADEVCLMADKSEEDGFQQDTYDALKVTIEQLKAQVARIERAEKLATDLAAPLAGLRRTPTVPAEPRKLYASLRAYKDKRDRVGKLIRAEDAAYAAGMWLKACIFHHKAAEDWCAANGIITRAQSEGVDSAGGFLVPEQMLQSIIDLREQYGVIRQQATVVPMARDTLSWPRRSGGLTAYFIGENQTLTESQASWDNVQLTAHKLGILTRFSTELEEDSVVSIADWLTNEMAYAFARKEDDCALNGTGTSTYGGIQGLITQAESGSFAGSVYTPPAAAGSIYFHALSLLHMTSLMGKLPKYALANAKWYMSETAFAATVERLIAAGAGNSIDTLSGEITYSFLGYPVVISQLMPMVLTTLASKFMLMFGDMKLSTVMGDRRSMTIRRSDERWFDQDQVGLIATERVDIVNHDVGSSSTAGPMVFLVAPAN